MKFLTGTVYSKALAIFLAASLLLLGAVIVLTQLVISREFYLTEQREMKNVLQRFSVVMDRESKPLEVAVAEWARSAAASWQRRESQFEAFLSDEVAERDIDFAGVFDGRGNLLRIASPEGFSSAEPDLLKQALVDAAKAFPARRGTTGYVLVGDRLCFLAAFPVETGDGSGPMGYICGGRIVGSGTWGFLEGLFSATIKFNLFKNASVNEGTGRDFATLLNRQEIVIEAEDTTQITGYRLITGLDGLPLGYISITQPRPLRQEGLRAIQIFLTGVCLAGGALVLVVWLLLDRTILARIKDLTRKLNAEKKLGRLPVKLDFAGEDELGTLARSIEDLAALLQRTQFQYRAVVEDQTEMICRFDAEGKLAFANQVFAKMFRIGSDSLAGGELKKIFPEKTAADFWSRFCTLQVEKSLTTYLHEADLGEPGRVWLRCTLRKNFSAEGVCQGGQWVSADVTAQVEAQRQMLELEGRFRRLFETSSDGILLLEWDTLAISDINPSLCRMLLLAGSEVLGQPFDQIAVFAPCLDVVHYHRRAHLDGARRAPIRNECRLARADGSALYVELRCSAYEVTDGRFIQLNFRNISERVLGERELRKLSAKLLRLQDEERRRIARELHDSTAQNLSALEMNMSLLEPMIEKSQPRASQLVAETRQIAGECSRELRNISYLLHPPLIDEVGLAFAIKWFADGFAKRTGIATTVEIEKEFPRLDADIEMPLFRIVQEGMTNIYRHSGADHAWVSLQREGNFLNMEIRDNGRGFEEEVWIDEDGSELIQEVRPGVGLAGMRERLANLGGKLDIENSPLGVTISIRLTLEHLHASAEP